MTISATAKLGRIGWRTATMRVLLLLKMITVVMAMVLLPVVLGFGRVLPSTNNALLIAKIGFTCDDKAKSSSARKTSVSVRRSVTKTESVAEETCVARRQLIVQTAAVSTCAVLSPLRKYLWSPGAILASAAAAAELEPASDVRLFVSTKSDSINYGDLQDLLGVDGGSSDNNNNEIPQTQTYIPQGSRPTWLTDPTDDFKQNEAKSSEFKRAQLSQKQRFLSVMEQFESDPNEEAALTRDLDALRKMVREQKGLPMGVTRNELVNRIRRRKAKRYWTTTTEIAYQDLLQEIRFQQNPNAEKDMDNPF